MKELLDKLLRDIEVSDEKRIYVLRKFAEGAEKSDLFKFLFDAGTMDLVLDGVDSNVLFMSIFGGIPNRICLKS